MITCANCNALATYDYKTICYCEKHLPRFLRTKNGVAVSVVKVTQPVFDGPQPELYVGPPPVETEAVEEAPKAVAAKKRPKPAAPEAPVVEVVEEVEEDAPKGE